MNDHLFAPITVYNTDNETFHIYTTNDLATFLKNHLNTKATIVFVTIGDIQKCKQLVTEFAPYELKIRINNAILQMNKLLGPKHVEFWRFLYKSYRDIVGDIQK